MKTFQYICLLMGWLAFTPICTKHILSLLNEKEPINSSQAETTLVDDEIDLYMEYLLND